MWTGRSPPIPSPLPPIPDPPPPILQVGFLESFLDEKRMELCVVMEFADGGDLSAKVEKQKATRKNMPEELVWAYLLQLLDGLSAIHAKRIIHRGGCPPFLDWFYGGAVALAGGGW